MNMPVLKNSVSVTKDQMAKFDVDAAVHASVSDPKKIRQNLSDILSVKEIKKTMEMLSKV